MKYHVNVNRHHSMADTLILFQGCETSPAREDGRIYIHTSDAAAVVAQLTRLSSPERPEIVTLCGSTRFSEAFQRANLYETLAEHIVLTIGCNFKSDDALGLDDEDRAQLDRLHLHKIDLSNTVLILNVGDYLGQSTRNEFRHAIQQQKRILLLGSHRCDADCPCPEGDPFPIVEWSSDAYWDFCNEFHNHLTVYGEPVLDMVPQSRENGRIDCTVTYANGSQQVFRFDVRPRAVHEVAPEHAEVAS